MALVFWYLSIFNSKLLAIAQVIVISNSDKKFRAMMEDKKEDQLLMKTCFEKKLPLLEANWSVRVSFNSNFFVLWE